MHPVSELKFEAVRFTTYQHNILILYFECTPFNLNYRVIQLDVEVGWRGSTTTPYYATRQEVCRLTGSATTSLPQ